MASGHLSAELTATCNALGYYDGQTYHLEPHCIETAKDLIRYLRRDDDTHEIRRFYGNTKIIQTDLLPLIQCHSDNQELFDVVLRLLVNLTNPAFLVYKESVPKDKTVRNQYLELVSQLQSAKEVFAQHKPWDVLAEKLSILLNTPENLRDDDMRRNIERILILIRNVLHVPLCEAEARPDNDASIHDQVLWALHQSGMLDLILYIVSSTQEEYFFMHILEVICLMVREQPASLLAHAASTRSNDEKNRDSDELLSIRKRESIANQQKIRKYQGMRNFGGTYVIKNMKSTSDKDIIYHKPILNLNKISLDLDKKKIKIPKNRQPLQCYNVERRSALSVRLILKQFCSEILNAAYNPLMKAVKDSFVRGRTQDNDESYYFNAMTFFMEFNRSYKFQVKLVSETLSVESFHFVQKYLENWHDMMVTDKAKTHLWSSRMHFALKAYKELLYNLMEMDKNEDEGVRESSRVIKSNIFYVMEYREMLLMLMNNYKKPKFSLKYVCDLIETVHVFLKLLENFAKNRKIFVQKKVSKPRRKNTKKVTKPKNLEQNTEELWNKISPELSTALASPVNKEVYPFDAASDVTIDEQKILAVKKIQTLLKSGSFEEAVAYLRTSRDIWTENDTFGGKDSSQEDELSCFKDVFFADLDIGFPDDEEEEDNAPLSEEEEENYPPPIEERSFDVSDFLKSFANPRTVYICGILMKSYETNSRMVNHCVAKMLHRIAWDCKLPSMIFQASIFRSFQRMLSSHNPNHNELSTLAKYIVKKFVEVAAHNKKLLIELLFWKSSKDAYDIEVGYGSYQEKSKAAKIMWEEHEEDELRRLYMEYKSQHPDEELTKDNVVPWITNNLIKERTELGVAKKLREMLLVVGKSSKKKPALWSPEEEEQLKIIFEEYKGTDDPVSHILNKFPDRSRRIVNNTLLRLGVVQDRSELKPKKQYRRRKPQNSAREESDDSESSSDEERVNMDDEKMKQRSAMDRPSLYKSIHELITKSSSKQYLTEGVEWLHESMKDNIDDCDDDPAEIPLLPLSESAIKSVDDKLFQNLLLALGLFSPFQQQEIYWRFSATWNSDDYSKRIELVGVVAEHCKNKSHSISHQLKDLIVEKFGDQTLDKIDEAADSSDDELNHTKDDFEAMVARHCQETLKERSSSPLGENSSTVRSLLYSKSDDESHAELNESSKKELFNSKKRSLNSKKKLNLKKKSVKAHLVESDSDDDSSSTSTNPFMSKVKQMLNGKIKIDNLYRSDSEEENQTMDNNTIKSKLLLTPDGESNKENLKSARVDKSDNILFSAKNVSKILSDSEDSNSEIENGKYNKDVNSKSDHFKSNIVTNKLKRTRIFLESDDSDNETLDKDLLGNKNTSPTLREITDENVENNQVNGGQKRAWITLDSDEESHPLSSVSSNKKRHIIESDED